METRKIIAFGDSTFSITLPKKWVVKHKLKKGDTVAVKESALGGLEVFPGTRKGEPEVKKITIRIDDRPLREVQREFIAAYIKGYSVIDLIGDHQGKVSELRRRLHELIGVEIMEVAHDRITTNVFFDVSAVSLEKIIARIALITKTIFDETILLIKKKKNLDLLYRELVEKKREVDRQSLFAIRIIVNALTEPSFAAKMDTDPLDVSFIWHLIEYMEKTSDYLLGVGFYISSTDFLSSLDKPNVAELTRLFSQVADTYSLSLKSYTKQSIPSANRVFASHTRNDRALYKFLYKNRSRWMPVVTGYLRRVSSKSRDIAKITINVHTK